jgi:hypothetical protein
MSNVVFILGAGCSKECGAPLMSNFLDVAQNLYKTNNVGSEAQHFERVFKAIGFLQAVHSKSQLDLKNIESIFNAFEIANTLKKLPGFKPEDIPEVIKSLKELIVTTLENTVKFPTRREVILAPQPYLDFASLVKYILNNALPKRTVSVITFNYDIALDVSFIRSGIPITYCLDDNSNQREIPLLKLHGSLNWASKISDNSIIPLPLEMYFQHYHAQGFQETSTCSIPMGKQLKACFEQFLHVEVKDEPVLVPPTWNKAEYYQTISKVWSNAAKELGEAEHVFIIGYSLPVTDAFFRLLFALGTVGNSPFQRVEVFNPDKNGETVSKFESLMGPGAIARFSYIYQGFSESIATIRGYFPPRPQ